MITQIQQAKSELEQKLIKIPGFIEYLGLIALEKSLSDKYPKTKISELSKLPDTPNLLIPINPSKDRGDDIFNRVRDAARKMILEELDKTDMISANYITNKLRVTYPEEFRQKPHLRLNVLLGDKWKYSKNIKLAGKTYYKKRKAS